jgi:hypothetical protein
MSVDLALLDFFIFEIGRAHRALERHRPDLRRRCVACSTQREAAPWPCRICATAAQACELTAKRPESAADRLFQAAIHHNAVSETVPLRAVPRSVPGASASGRHRTTKEEAK